MERAPDLDRLLAALRSGDRATLARCITLIESVRPDEQRTAQELIERCLQPAGAPKVRIGITGIPGVGKSTLIDVLGLELIGRGHRVAVLAVDPSSARTGGSILGDKTRMDRLAADERAFIRPSPTSGNLGGIARRTRETVILCETAGYDRVLIETVGVGQNELAVDGSVDVTVLLTLAGAGDELQGIKRGIMEAADLIMLTKADGDNRSRSEQARLDLRNAIALLPPRANGKRPDVLIGSAVEQEGISTLADRIEALASADLASGHFMERRRAQDRERMREAITEALLDGFHRSSEAREALPRLEEEVMAGRMTPFRAAAELVALFKTASGPRP